MRMRVVCSRKIRRAKKRYQQKREKMLRNDGGTSEGVAQRETVSSARGA